MTKGPYPLLHKYLSLEGQKLDYALSTISDETFYMQLSANFNDPFDCLFTPMAVPNNRDIREFRKLHAKKIALAKNLGPYETRQVEKRVLKLSPKAIVEELNAIVTEQTSTTGVCCFSELNDNMLMWSHYANSHSGILITIDPNFSKNEILLVMPVNYVRERPKVELPRENPSELSEQIVQKILYSKAECWDYEKEWRIISLRKHGVIKFPPNIVSSITLGAKITGADRKAVIEANLKRKTPLQINQAHLADNEFQIVIEENVEPYL